MSAFPRLRGGLRWRVVVGMVATAVVSLALMAVASVLVVRRELINNQRATALEETRAAMALVDDQLASPSRRQLAALNRELRQLGSFEVVAVVDGVSLGTTDRVGLADVPGRLRSPQAGVDGAEPAATASGDYLVTARRPGGHLTYYLFFPQETLHRDLATLTEVVGLVAVGTAAVVIVGTVVATRRLFRPVDETAAAAQELAAGALGTRVPDRSRGFPDLTAAFNEMAEALQETIERLRSLEARQRQFVANVSHELRTPMTALGTAADLLEPAVHELEGAQKRAAEMLTGEVRRLHRMVEDLLDISQLDAGADSPRKEPVRVARAVNRLLRRRRIDDDVRLRVEGDPVVKTDPRRLHIILGNLVDNALQHGGAPVEVEATADGARVVVDVVDHGSGVPDGDRARIFDRFHKADPARTRDHGSGLGLAIARESARLLGGELQLAPARVGEGARFRLTLPTSVEAGDAPLADV